MSKADAIASRSGFKPVALLELVKSVWDLLPSGGSLPAEVWQKRHRFLLGLTWFHALLIALVGPVLGYSWELSLAAPFHEDTVLHTVTEALAVAFFASAASWGTTRRVAKATAVGFGLMSASAILVHLSGGYIELHFHFFVMLTFLALYQDWAPYLLAIVYVAIHHGVVGVVWPQEVYNHASAINAPWTWAGIHAFFVLWAAVGSVIAWRFNEKAVAQTKLILDSAGEGIYGLDRSGKVTFMNPAAAALLHCEPQEAIGKALQRILRHTRGDGSDFTDHLDPILLSLREGARRQGTDELFHRNDGTSFPVEYVSTAIFEREEVAGVVVSFVDISRRKRRDAALRESEERFRQIAENIKEVFWVTDPLKLERLYVSPAYREVWGKDPSGADSLSQAWLGGIHPEDLGRVLTAVNTKQLLGQYDEEYRIVRPDGSIRRLRDRAFPVKNKSGKVYRMIGIAEDITERKQAEEELQSRYNELAILHDMSQMTLRSTDLKEVLEKVLEHALSVVSLDLGNIRLFESNGRMRLGVYRGYRDAANIDAHHTDMQGPNSGILIPQVIASGKSLVVNDISTAEGGLRTFKKEAACSAILVPIITEDETIGVIEVASRTPCTFRADQVRLLEAIGNQVGIAAQKARLIEETESRAREQEALNVIARSISQSLHRDELLEIALDKVLEVTGRERISIRLKDPATGQVALAAHRGFSRDEVEELLRRASHAVSEKVFASGQPLVIDSRQEIDDSRSLLPQSRSVAWIPMKAGARVVGILGISASSPLPFSQREVEFLQAIANMIAVALENARLYENQSSQVKSLKLLLDASQKLVERVDVDALAQDILDTVVMSFGVRLAWIGSAEADGRVRPLYWAGDVADYTKRVEIRWDDSPLGHGPAGQAIRTGRPVVMNVALDPGFAPWREPALARGYREVAAFPLMRGAKPFGHLILYSGEVGFFTLERTELLQTYANIATAALENVRLFQQTRRQAQEQAALNSIATAVSHSLDVREILNIAMDKVLEVTGREQGYIRLKDPRSGNLALVVHRGISEGYVKTLLHERTPGGETDQVLESGEPLVINDPEGSVLKEQTRYEGSRSMGWFPLKVRGQAAGVMNVSTTRRIPFQPREVELLKAIGNVIGVALENARLFSETESHYRELQTLHSISDTILDSRDLKVMMQRILDQAFEIGHFDIGVVNLLSSTGESIEPVASRGYRDPTNVEGHRKKLGEYTTGAGSTRVMEEKKVAVVDLTRSKGMRTLKKEGVCTVAVVPLRSHDEVLGVMQLGNRTQREFRDDELRILDAIGRQTGIAVQKARLYEESQRAQAALAEKAEELARSNQELQHFAYVASHDLQEPLRMVASYVQLLARRYKGKLESEADEFIDFAVDGATRMKALINALLAYSRIGSKAKSFEPVDCDKVIAAALKNLQLAVEESQATVSHDSLPTVMGDATQLGQLFQNLIGNAIKFRGDNSPHIHIAAARNGTHWTFSCRDNGIGIDPQYFERIFIIFQRLHSKEEYSGTGIGLALCRKIVERHGGRIWVESEGGKGSQFLFTIPV